MEEVNTLELSLRSRVMYICMRFFAYLLKSKNSKKIEQNYVEAQALRS